MSSLSPPILPNPLSPGSSLSFKLNTSRHMNIMDPVASHNPGHRLQCDCVLCKLTDASGLRSFYLIFLQSNLCKSLAVTHSHTHTPIMHTQTLIHTNSHLYVQTHTRHIPYSPKGCPLQRGQIRHLGQYETQ